VEFVNWDGTILSSAQYPARVGYKNDWVTATKEWRGTHAFLKREELPDGVALSVAAVRTVSGGNDKNLYIIGGRRLDQNFLASLVLPAGMRALLYRNLEPTFVSVALTDVNGTPEEADRFRPLIEQVQKKPQPVVDTINWRADAASAETFHAMPLLGRNRELLGVLWRSLWACWSACGWRRASRGRSKSWRKARAKSRRGGGTRGSMCAGRMKSVN
jgi:hypothetical protein